MNEQPRFYSLDELRQLDLKDLQALWELIPSERQRAYRAAYEREVRNAGALGSDQLEQQVTDELLHRYLETALVPVGMRWARTPSRIQEAAKNDDMLVSSEERPDRSDKPPIFVLVMGTILVVMMVAIFLYQANQGNSDPVVAEATSELEASATPQQTATPTPLALEAQDDIIQDGDDERRIAYPVSLQVALPDESSPRVWVVQRRAVRASEWHFDPNPDIASFINGMSVRPIIGIPYSQDNATWFDNMRDGTVFRVTMNTGAILRFEYATRSDVRRSDTDIFRQVSPGLVLLLIGERDEDGLPTATRTLITASYPPEQELGRDGELIGLALPSFQTAMSTETPTPENNSFTDIDVQIISVTTQTGQLTTQFRIYNSGENTLITQGEHIQLALGYVPNPVGPFQPADGLLSQVLLPEQAIDIHVTWLWNNEPYAVLEILDYQFSIAIE